MNSSGNRKPSGGRLRLLVGLAVSGFFVVLLLWQVDWGRFWASLLGADYWWLLASMGMLALAVGLKVVRWQLLLLPAGRTSPVHLLYAIATGYLVSAVLPGRLGELARVYLLARLERLSLVTVLSTVAVDRILDVVVLALLLAISLPTADLPVWMAQSGLVVGAGGVALLALCVLLAYPRWRGLFLGILKALPALPGKALVESWAEGVCLGLDGLRGVGAQLRITATSLAIWGVTVLIFYFGQLAFHIQAPLWSAVLVTALTSLGMVVPSSPGYVGVFHYLVVVGLGAYGVEKEVALGFAVVIHLAEMLSLGLLGAFSLWKCGLSLMGWREAEATSARASVRR